MRSRGARTGRSGGSTEAWAGSTACGPACPPARSWDALGPGDCPMALCQLDRWWGACSVAAWAAGWGCGCQYSRTRGPVCGAIVVQHSRGPSKQLLLGCCARPHVRTVSPLGGVAAGLFTLVASARCPPEDVGRGASTLLSAGPGAPELSQVHGGACSHQLRHRGPCASAAPDRARCGSGPGGGWLESRRAGPPPASPKGLAPCPPQTSS